MTDGVELADAYNAAAYAQGQNQERKCLKEHINALEAENYTYKIRIAELERENAVQEVMCYYLAQCLHMREPERSTSWLLSEARRLCEEDLADEAEEVETECCRCGNCGDARIATCGALVCDNARSPHCGSRMDPWFEGCGHWSPKRERGATE